MNKLHKSLKKCPAFFFFLFSIYIFLTFSWFFLGISLNVSSFKAGRLLPNVFLLHHDVIEKTHRIKPQSK